MSRTHVIRNQSGQYATRKGEWVSGRDAAQVAHFVHHDQALNQLFELGLRDFLLRGQVVTVKLAENGKPVIDDFGPEPEVADTTATATQTAEAAQLVLQ